MDITVSYQATTTRPKLEAFFEMTQHFSLEEARPLACHATLSGTNGTLQIGDRLTLDDAEYLVLGSGIAQAGIDLYHVPVGIGAPMDVVMLEDCASGEMTLAYPKGAPNFRGATMIIMDVDPVGYDLLANAPVCFVRGTMIETPEGERPVEEIGPGDLVSTFRGDPVRVLWSASLRYDQPLPHARPIVIERGAMGDRLPRRRLRLSPWHRLPLPGTAERVPLLAPAAALTRLPRVKMDTLDGPISYHHFVTEKHALVLAEGQPAETLFPADPAMENLSHEARKDMLSAMGCDESSLATHSASSPCGRFLTLREARQILRAAIAIEFAA